MRLSPRVCILLALAGLSYAQVANAFVIREIRVESAQGINKETVLNYLPVHVGEEFSSSQSGSVISALYASGLFSNVSLAQQDGVLIVRVAERQVICSVSVTGNKSIPTDKINEVLKNVGLTPGQVFDRSVLDRMARSLKSEYDNQGKYNACVTPVVTPEAHNRVAIRLDISEGKSVILKQITIIGNCAFSRWRLLQQMTLTTPRPWTFFTRTDQYCQEKLEQSLEGIRSYYLDHGYLKFKIDSAQATLTPDRKYVYLVIHVTEGPIYTIRGFQVAGNLILPREKLMGAVSAAKIASGCPFSRCAIQDATKSISGLLGDLGYMFANVNVNPEVNEDDKTVFLTFYVDPGNRVYVRRINFCGNTKTQDIVLRRSIVQMEGGVATNCDIQESERSLNLTGFLAEPAHVEPAPVPGLPDQVDLNYKVVEAPSASATAGAGYGTQGYVLNAGFNQPNFLGTGNTFGINFSNSLYSTSLSMSYVDPYYTEDGVSRGITVFGQRTTPGRINIASYTTDVYGGNVTYSIPVTRCGDSIQLGYGYQDLILTIGSNPSRQLAHFVHLYGERFNETMLNFGWSRNTLDRAVFPTNGMFQSLTLQVALPGAPHHIANYYKAGYNFNYYHPIACNFLFTARGALGYGAGLGGTHGLPFFANYYAGGIGSTGEVRGYQANSLGPRDSQRNPLGGNELITGTLGIIFPNPVGEDKLRTMAFFDAGNVYSSKARIFGGSSAGPMRTSIGIAADWRVPIMNVLLEVAVAKALNPQHGDSPRMFDFSVGTSF